MDRNYHSLCPCGSGQLYKLCCQPYHLGTIDPNSQALMRSRYCAYSLGLVDFILNTTHPCHVEASKPQTKRRNEIQQFCQTTTFQGLTILKVEEEEERSTITFTASLSRKGEDYSFTERSTFEKMLGRWLYLKAEFITS